MNIFSFVLLVDASYFENGVRYFFDASCCVDFMRTPADILQYYWYGVKPSIQIVTKSFGTFSAEKLRPRD
jgi:hypothetical protein